MMTEPMVLLERLASARYELPLTGFVNENAPAVELVGT
jgi:hypothetical protein